MLLPIFEAKLKHSVCVCDKPYFAIIVPLIIKTTQKGPIIFTVDQSMVVRHGFCYKFKSTRFTGH